MGTCRQILGLSPCLNKLETISTFEETHVPHRQEASPIVDDILDITSENTQKRAHQELITQKGGTSGRNSVRHSLTCLQHAKFISVHAEHSGAESRRPYLVI